MTYKRNGDHYFHKVSELPKGLKKLSKKGEEYIFGVGEASNHVHTLVMPKLGDYEVYEDDKGRKFFEIKVEGTLAHLVGGTKKTADHKKTKIAPGFYVQVPEREVDIFSQTVRKVID